MNRPHFLNDRASELVEAARAFLATAEVPTSHAAAPDSLASLEEAMQVLSAAWYRVAADAAPGIAARRPRVDSLSREQEVRLVASLHDVAAAFARCARACREGRTTVAPLIARRAATGPTDDGGRGDELSWFEGRRESTQRVA